MLVYRTVTESTEQGGGGRQGIGLGGGGGGGGGGAPRMGGSMQWSIPFRAYSAANWLALNCQRHMHEYGTTTDQLAMIAINARRNAGHQPEGRVPRPDDARRLLRVAHDHHARSASSTATPRSTAPPR